MVQEECVFLYCTLTIIDIKHIFHVDSDDMDEL